MLILEFVRNLQRLSWLYKRKVCFPEDRWNFVWMFLWSVRFAGLCVAEQSENMQRSLSWGLVSVMSEHFTSTESSRPTPPARTQPCCCPLCPCPWSILQSSTTNSFYQTCSTQKNNTTTFMGHRIRCQPFTYLYLFLVLIVVFIFSIERSIFIYSVDSSLR